MQTPASTPSRRDLLLVTAATGTAILVGGCQNLSAHSGDKDKGDEEGEKVTPGEDLMQEHGVLKRILLVYGEGIRRLQANEDLPPDPLQKAAKLVRSFVEEYHEQQEEQFLFPRMRQANKHVDLVETLLQQHRAGRQVTERIITLATLPAMRDAGQKQELIHRLDQFIRMYAAHEAREDTVLFPAFRDMVSKSEYEALGEQFEKNEQRHFGGDGFDMAVDQIADIEKALNIYDLSKVTPQI